MNCPKCQERLRSEQYRDNKYLICFYCEGAWVKKSELDTHSVLGLAHTSAGETEYPCPCCTGEVLSHTEALGLELDYCKECEGVFFDKGELEAVASDYKSINGEQLAFDTAKAVTFIDAVSKAVGFLFRLMSR